tara:strand:- start:338 stop:589 length:252 start_codon:yes stop_codon:yes gene_type:complete
MAKKTETVEAPPEPQIHSINLGDLNAVIRIIDVCSKRGAINGDELADVGAVRNRIQQFVTASTPVAAPAEVTDEEVTDETTAE